jgi:hypothetical protein
VSLKVSGLCGTATGVLDRGREDVINSGITNDTNL